MKATGGGNVTCVCFYYKCLFLKQVLALPTLSCLMKRVLEELMNIFMNRFLNYTEKMSFLPVSNSGGI